MPSWVGWPRDHMPSEWAGPELIKLPRPNSIEQCAVSGAITTNTRYVTGPHTPPLPPSPYVMGFKTTK